MAEKQMESQLGKQKGVELFGNRRTGKTAIIENTSRKRCGETLQLSVQNIETVALLQ